MKKELNIVIAGVGGQGSILASHILAEAVIETSGSNNVRVGETYGAAMRGGSVSSHVRIGDVYGPLIRKDGGDIIVSLEPLEGLRNAVKYLAPEGIFITNDTPVLPIDVKLGYGQYPSVAEIKAMVDKLGKEVYVVPGSELAKQAGNHRTLNSVMLGALVATGLLPVAKETLQDMIAKRVPSKTVDTNLKAFDLGYAYMQQVKV
ncbi:MAG: indolepyruvate oxidoreductase subunit beta [bacterium]